MGFIENRMKKKAIIVSIKSLKLTIREKLLLSQEKPWGLILFKRNIKNLKQLKNLIQNIKNLTNDKNFPILIDEEGVSVSRLRNIIQHNISANFFGRIYSKNPYIAIQIYKSYLSSLCRYLKNIGININTIPVLDILRKNTNKVIGNRSFSDKKKIVKKLGKITVEQCSKHKIISVIKHIPGHGCGVSDSHFKMPKVNLSIKELNNKDFYSFKSNHAKLAMTAHILYTKIDSINVATFSKKLSMK